MSDLKELLDREARRVDGAPDALGWVLRRRDRKRRNQRIRAGVVGMALFVAALLVVTTFGFLGQATVPSGEGTTGPAETGPAETGPAETGPAVTGNPGHPFSVDNGFAGLPPEGATLSHPARGEVVASGDSYRYHARVYADGRLIWQYDDSLWLERRLTPKGVDLVRSQPELLERSHPGLVIAVESLPESAWESPQARQYAAPLYGVCTSREGIRHLPQRALNLVGDYTNAEAVERGEVEFFGGGNGSTCPEVTLEEARELDRILRDNGYRRTDHSGEGVWYEFRDLNPYIVVMALLPDGSLAQSGGA
jgi:hypothetical protein